MDVLRSGASDAPYQYFMAHGAGAPMDSPFMAHVADAIAGPDIEVIRFEFPYMQARRIDGKKRPPDRAPKLIAHWTSVIEHEARQGSKLIIGGKSMGGRIATMTAAEQKIHPAGIVCLGYPFHAPGKPDAVRISHLPDIACPLLILQGTRDALGNSTDVAGYSLPDTVQMHWLEDGDHDLKPRKASGLSHTDHMDAAASAVRAFVLSL